MPKSDYETKFAEFIRMCASPEVDGIVVLDPADMGDNYEELLESLRRVAASGKILTFPPPQVTQLLNELLPPEKPATLVRPAHRGTPPLAARAGRRRRF